MTTRPDLLPDQRPATDPPEPRRPGLPVLAVAVAVAGLGGGVLTQVLQGVLDDPWAAWADSVAAWCLVATGIGSFARSPRRATVAGVAVLALLLVGYYGASALEGATSSPRTVAIWAVGAVLGGVVFGLAGAAWRSPSAVLQVVGASLPAAALVGEGLVRHLRFPWQGSAGVVMVVAGAVLAVVLGRTWRRRGAALAVAAGVVPLALLGDHLLNAAFRL